MFEHMFVTQLSAEIRDSHLSIARILVPTGVSAHLPRSLPMTLDTPTVISNVSKHDAPNASDVPGYWTLSVLKTSV